MDRQEIITQLSTSSQPWVRYNVAVQLKEQDRQDKEVKIMYHDLINSPLIKNEIKTCQKWPEPPLKSHKAASHPIHHLRVLADLGLTMREKTIKKLVDSMFKHQAENGAMQSLEILPRIWGGSDQPEWLWMFCDAPVLLHACLALGVDEDDPRIKAALEHLSQLIEDRGYVCSSSLQKLKGPGKKDDPCPYATLLTLRAFALTKNMKKTSYCKQGTEVLLQHWENRAKKKLRMFGIGTEFSKIKFPFVFYDILHVVEVLSHFSWVWEDKRFQEMLSRIEAKRDPSGLFTPESVWMAFKGFDFAQKKQPSPMVTMLVELIYKRKPAQ